MSRFIAFLLATVAAHLAIVPSAHSAPRKQKPSVCQKFTKATAEEGTKFIICFDGKRPQLWSGETVIVSLRGKRVAVGYRTTK